MITVGFQGSSKVDSEVVPVKRKFHSYFWWNDSLVFENSKGIFFSTDIFPSLIDVTELSQSEIRSFNIESLHNKSLRNDL